MTDMYREIYKKKKKLLNSLKVYSTLYFW